MSVSNFEYVSAFGAAILNYYVELKKNDRWRLPLILNMWAPLAQRSLIIMLSSKKNDRWRLPPILNMWVLSAIKYIISK